MCLLRTENCALAKRVLQTVLKPSCMLRCRGLFLEAASGPVVSRAATPGNDRVAVCKCNPCAASFLPRNIYTSVGQSLLQRLATRASSSSGPKALHCHSSPHHTNYLSGAVPPALFNIEINTPHCNSIAARPSGMATYRGPDDGLAIRMRQLGLALGRQVTLIPLDEDNEAAVPASNDAEENQDDSELARTLTVGACISFMRGLRPENMLEPEAQSPGGPAPVDVGRPARRENASEGVNTDYFCPWRAVLSYPDHFIGRRNRPRVSVRPSASSRSLTNEGSSVFQRHPNRKGLGLVSTSACATKQLEPGLTRPVSTSMTLATRT